MKRYNIKLGSKSPRRQELLRLLDIDFEVMSGKEVDETYPADLPVDQIPEYLAKLKAGAWQDELADDDLLITADTVVICGGQVLGKPCDEADAKRMLRELSGRTHTVVTGVAITTVERSESFSVATDVEFAPLSAEEIERYVEKYRPLDKAGAYGIQEWIGAAGITGINGSFYNVMGLPMRRLYEALKGF